MRWPVNKAAIEFGVHRDTLTKALKSKGLDAKKGKTFHTRQVHKALAGDLEVEKTRESRARADLLELEKAELDARLIPREKVSEMIAVALMPVRNWMLSLAANLGHRCNPTDPAHARGQIQAEIDAKLPEIRDSIDKLLPRPRRRRRQDDDDQEAET